MKKYAVAALLMLFSINLQAALGQTALVAGMGMYGGDSNTIPIVTFNQPFDVVIEPVTNNVYIADTYNHVIRKVDGSTGVVSTIAGSGSLGYAEGIGSAAALNLPSALALDHANGLLYFSDRGNHRIRSVNTSTGQTALVAGMGSAGGYDGDAVTTARFNNPVGVAFDTVNNDLYVADYGNNKIRKIDLDASTVVSVTGNGTGIAPADYIEGTGSVIRMYQPRGLAIDDVSGILYFADSGNFRIRQLDLSSYTSSLVAGSTQGNVEGIGAAALFGRVNGLAYDSTDNTLFVTEETYHTIRMIDLSDNSTYPVCGGSQGLNDGEGTAALFSVPYGIFASESDNTLFVADSGNHMIRTVDLDSNSLSANYAGLGVYGGDGNNALSATFNQPADIALNTLNGRMYIADTKNHVIRMIDETGVVSTIAGSGEQGYLEGAGDIARFNNPRSLALDPVNNKLYVSDSLNDRIRVIDLDTNVVSLVAGNGMGTPNYADGIGPAASFDNPEEIDISLKRNMLYVADKSNNAIRQIDLSTNAVTTLGGINCLTTGCTAAYIEKESSSGSSAWNLPEGLIYSSALDLLIIADTGHNIIRRLGLDAAKEGFVGATYTITGDNTAFTAAYVDGDFKTVARYDSPSRLVFYGEDYMLYVADRDNNAVRQAYLITGNDTVTTAGGVQGYKEDIGLAAEFDSVNGMALDFDNELLYVADTNNHRIRSIEVLVPTLTVTPTITPGGDTMTVTPTTTESPVVTETDTPTVTRTATVTLTSTVSQTVTMTSTPTVFISETVTPTVTVTATETMTSTVTQTVIITETVTQTITETDTPASTMTVTQSVTETVFATFSHTQTITQTSTQSATVTVSATSTETVTKTVTKTVTPTITRTLFVSMTDTPTVTQTITETPFMSPTASPTITMTPTPADTPVDFYGDRFFITETYPYPNPSRGLFFLGFDASRPIKKATVKIYTSAFRLIREINATPQEIALKKVLIDSMQETGNGVYHYVVICEDFGGETARKTGEIVLIK